MQNMNRLIYQFENQFRQLAIINNQLNLALHGSKT